jgi:hypothetical protein
MIHIRPKILIVINQNIQHFYSHVLPQYNDIKYD